MASFEVPCLNLIIFYWRLDIAYVLSKRDCRLNTHQELFHSNTVASSKHEVDTGFIQLLFPLVIMRVHDDIIVTLSFSFQNGSIR